MAKYIKRISTDFEGYDETVSEFITYNGTPFTGILFEERNGRVIEEIACIDGFSTGYVVDFYENGRIQYIDEHDRRTHVGISAEWDKEGNLICAKKIWRGEVVEQIIVRNGDMIYSKEMTQERINEILNSPKCNMYNYRLESVQELLAEAEEKIKNGTVFDDPRLYT